MIGLFFQLGKLGQKIQLLKCHIFVEVHFDGPRLLSLRLSLECFLP
jgi:hypothetical protein